jgi:hypothetical protein
MYNDEPDPSKVAIWKPYPDIECMLLQKFSLLYSESDYSEKYRLVNMGEITVDLKHMQ